MAVFLFVRWWTTPVILLTCDSIHCDTSNFQHCLLRGWWNICLDALLLYLGDPGRGNSSISGTACLLHLRKSLPQSNHGWQFWDSRQQTQNNHQQPCHLLQYCGKQCLKENTSRQALIRRHQHWHWQFLGPCHSQLTIDLQSLKKNCDFTINCDGVEYSQFLQCSFFVLNIRSKRYQEYQDMNMEKQ